MPSSSDAVDCVVTEQLAAATREIASVPSSCDCHGVNYVGAGRWRHAMQFRFLAFRQIAIARSPIAKRVRVKRTRGDVGGGNHARFCFLFAAGRFAFRLPHMHALDLRARDAGGSAYIPLGPLSAQKNNSIWNKSILPSSSLALA
uniref:Uncharacterized protein n=1 Tax=Oryza sativa subsp. japonica TaxID=39947 RepID=Q6K8V1_ORYSJ|nr:hypothetical protein [Oryza sativa Japonica Group]BAD19309.1 hypothetical protein [Oryza sativa Japonica Group]